MPRPYILVRKHQQPMHGIRHHPSMPPYHVQTPRWPVLRSRRPLCLQSAVSLAVAGTGQAQEGGAGPVLRSRRPASPLSPAGA